MSRSSGLWLNVCPACSIDMRFCWGRAGAGTFAVAAAGMGSGFDLWVGSFGVVVDSVVVERLGVAYREVINSAGVLRWLAVRFSVVCGCSFGLWWAYSAESTSLLTSLGSSMMVSNGGVFNCSSGVRFSVALWVSRHCGGMLSYSVWGGVRVQRCLDVLALVVVWGC